MITFKNKGFTLIELLVVVGIISLMSSMVFASVNVARAKGRDARKQQEVASVKTALTLYKSQATTMPLNYNCNGTYCASGGGNQLAIEDAANPTNPTTASGQAYNRSMQDLVDAKVISTIPHTTGGPPYTYYDYGPDTPQGALFATNLEFPPPTNQNATCFATPREFDDVPLMCTVQDPITRLYRRVECPASVTNICTGTNNNNFCGCNPY